MKYLISIVLILLQSCASFKYKEGDCLIDGDFHLVLEVRDITKSHYIPIKGEDLNYTWNYLLYDGHIYYKWDTSFVENNIRFEKIQCPHY